MAKHGGHRQRNQAAGMGCQPQTYSSSESAYEVVFLSNVFVFPLCYQTSQSDDVFECTVGTYLPKSLPLESSVVHGIFASSCRLPICANVARCSLSAPAAATIFGSRRPL